MLQVIKLQFILKQSFLWLGCKIKLPLPFTSRNNCLWAIWLQIRFCSHYIPFLPVSFPPDEIRCLTSVAAVALAISKFSNVFWMGWDIALQQVLLIKMTFLNNLLLSAKDKMKLSLAQPPQTTEERLIFKENYSQEINILCFSAVYVGPLVTIPFFWLWCTALQSSFASCPCSAAKVFRTIFHTGIDGWVFFVSRLHTQNFWAEDIWVYWTTTLCKLFNNTISKCCLSNGVQHVSSTCPSFITWKCGEIRLLIFGKLEN